MLQQRLSISIRWNKVDSHIETWVYKEGQSPAGDALSIRLNQVVDAWAGEAWEAGQHTVESMWNPQIFYDESQIMVRAPSQRFI